MEKDFHVEFARTYLVLLCRDPWFCDFCPGTWMLLSPLFHLLFGAPIF
jgi:hypothetical protein